jgi:DNA-binding response OmpR family regulator
VDDENAFCEVVCEILEAAGYRARMALNVEQAYLCLEEEIPDLILTDIMMPDTDGLTFIRELKESSAYASIPAVIVSACTTPSDEQNALDAGALHILSKPFSSNDLEVIVDSLLTSS